jgi:hypothetical protein
MKFSTAIILSIIASANAFTSAPTIKASTALNMNSDVTRRAAFATIATGAIASTFPSAAFALGDAPPTFDNMKQVLALGLSLDKLKEQVGNPDTSEAALVGLRVFNRDANYYTTYTRNFISKTVKRNAEGDVRVGYIKQASAIIGSIQELLEGRQGLQGADAAKEAVVRVEKAQALIAKFVAECGIENERFGPYIAAHP